MCNTLKTKKALIETMCFFDIFDFALTKDELCDYMLSEKCTRNELQDFIDHQEFLMESNNHVYFRGRPITLQVRKDKEIRAHKLIGKAKKFVKYFQMIPFVRSVSICNSLSFYAADKGSDIDLFIITEKNRLFLARSLTWIFTHLLGIRRHGNKVKGRFCLSFMISREELNLELIKNEKDIYLVFWLRLLRPIIGQKYYREFISENKWIKEHFTYDIDQQKHLLPESSFLLNFQKILEAPFKSFVGDFFEGILSKWQIKRCNKKAAKLNNDHGIIAKKCILKFHNIDMRPTFQKIWNLRFNHFAHYLTSEVVHDNESLSQSRETQTLYESRFQDNAYKKSETHSPDLQKKQTQEG